ncbi:MAG: DUF2490 domain-containing protein [Bacteroidaceae bacterium]|nr:DUF2490 domain-containing protein [Bacteroidaceae bacterium]
MTLRRYIFAFLLLAPCPLLLVVSAQESNDEVGIWSEIGIEKGITKNWDVGLDMEYRAQNKARFSVGLGTSYKLNKYLKLGINYSFLYSEKNKYKIKDEGEVGSDDWTRGYNLIDEWYPRHRFSAEAIGSIKLWKWLKVSLRERYQLTHRKAWSAEKLEHRENHLMQYDFDEDWNPIIEEEITITDKTVTKYYPTLTDQVLRSRLKFEMDKKRCPFSPFVSAEFHNSVGVGDHMLLQKIRTAAGCSYKFRKHNEVSLSYIITFDMYDIEEDETMQETTVRLHDRMHAISLGYKYSF